MKNVLVPIANGTEEMEAVIIVDMLRRAGCDVTMAGEGNVVVCAHGLRVIPDVDIEDIGDEDEYDAVILPGGMQGVERFVANTQLERILSRHRTAKKLVGAICAAPTVLHEFGLLPSSSIVTSHPSVADVMAQYTYTLDRVVVDGDIVTSRGAGTAFEFALTIIRLLVGETASTRIATDIVLYE